MYYDDIFVVNRNRAMFFVVHVDYDVLSEAGPAERIFIRYGLVDAAGRGAGDAGKNLTFC